MAVCLSPCTTERVRTAVNQTSAHVALFVPSLSVRYGGAEKVLLTLANGLARQGLRVDLVLLSASGPVLADIAPEVRLHNLCWPRRGLLALPGLLGYVRAARPAALIAALPPGNVAAIWTRFLAGYRLRVIVQEHSAIATGIRSARWPTRRLLPWLMRLCYPHADSIVAVSRGVAHDMTRRLHLSPARVRVIYNPIVTPELHALARADLDDPWFGPGLPPVVLGIGRLAAEKDFATLLQAFELVQAQRPARLLILGEGRERARLEALRHSLGLTEVVRLPGYTSNPYAYLSRAALLTQSSRSEGLPTVLVEALACGTPVVATHCEGGTAEILADGQYGTLVPPGDSAALAQAMLATLDHSPRADLLRQRAAAFTYERAVAQYMALLQELAQAGR